MEYLGGLFRYAVRHESGTIWLFAFIFAFFLIAFVVMGANQAQEGEGKSQALGALGGLLTFVVCLVVGFVRAFGKILFMLAIVAVIIYFMSR